MCDDFIERNKIKQQLENCTKFILGQFSVFDFSNTYNNYVLYSNSFLITKKRFNRIKIYQKTRKINDNNIKLEVQFILHRT